MNKSLKDNVVRFNAQAVQVEGYNDGMTLTEIVASLRPGKFFWLP